MTTPTLERLEALAAINYNLYLAGTVRRADTGEDWTYNQAIEELLTFITQEREEATKEEKRLWLKGLRCEGCGGNKNPDPLSDLCGTCWEEA